MNLQGPDEMPHGRVVLTMERYEAEEVAAFLVEMWEMRSISPNTEMGDLTHLLAPVLGYRTCDGCGSLEAGGPEQDGEGRSACCAPLTTTDHLARASLLNYEDGKQRVVHEGVVYTYKPHHGAWFSDPETEAEGTLHAPANLDGSLATDSVGEIQISYYESAGEPCEARCDLCLDEMLRDSE